MWQSENALFYLHSAKYTIGAFQSHSKKHVFSCHNTHLANSIRPPSALLHRQWTHFHSEPFLFKTHPILHKTICVDDQLFKDIAVWNGEMHLKILYESLVFILVPYLFLFPYDS
jgi:hypothetical protein